MLRIILTFILIYLVFRILTTFVFPWLASWYLKRFSKRFYRNNQWQGQHHQQKQEHGVHISGKPPESKKDDLGEYIDFEEIKEEKQDTKENKSKENN